MVDSKNAVITDEALAALLDRTLQSKVKDDPIGSQEKGPEKDSLKSATAHSDVFKVIVERDSSGMLLGERDGVCDNEPSTSGSLNAAGAIVMETSEDISISDSSSSTPEPVSNDSLKSSSSVSISSSSSGCADSGVQSMDVDTPPSSVLTGSYSPTPEPNAGGVVVADTEVKVCASEMEGEKLITQKLLVPS